MNITLAERPRFAAYIPLLFVLAAALALRVLLWGHIPRVGLISDEGEYLSAASWLAAGRGFSWYQGYLWTRAPLYPLLVAAHLRLFGDSLAPIYVTQTGLSLLDVALVYFLAKRLTTDDRRPKGATGGASRFSLLASQSSIPTLAAALMAIYLPFALYAQVLLSETLFVTLLLGGFLALAGRAGQRPRTKDQRREARFVGLAPLASTRSLVLAGVLFGLATLTRSLTLAFLPVAALWLFVQPTTDDQHLGLGTRGLGLLAADAQAPGPKPQAAFLGWFGRRLQRPTLFLIAAALTIAPWTLYSSRLYGGLVVVDTTGAFNLMLGARTAYDGNRNDAATREFLLAFLDSRLTLSQRRDLLEGRRADGTQVRDPSCLLRQNDQRLLGTLGRAAGEITQAERQQLMTAEGLCLVEARPAAFLRKSLGELVDLFQINYGGDERFADGFALGRLPRWYSAALFLLDDTIYVLALPLAVVGWALVRRTTNDERRTTGATRVASLVAGRTSLVVLWLLYNVAVAPLLFAINRFRLPLLPFVFVFAAYALAHQRQVAWRRIGWGYGGLAALLLLVAATPYAYLEPLAPGAPSTWASYLGPYPSSLAATLRAWQARPGYLAEQRVKAALGAGDAAEAARLLGSTDVTSYTLAIARPLLAGLQGQPDEGLRLLDLRPPLNPVDAEVLRGDLLRRKGDLAGARAVLSQTLVDNANPVAFAWEWLHPPPLPDGRIDLAGNLDLGYVDGCYLGEGDRAAAGNFRWCTDGARLRFPGAGTSAPQTLALRVDGRGWAGFATAAPPVSVAVRGQEVGSFTPNLAGPAEVSLTLPPTPAGADVIVTLRTATFVPPAERYLSQQGRSVVGQVQRLGVRIDWAALRPAGIEN